MPDKRADNSQHWSADFVQHIRAVHFSLIAVCIALLGAAVSVKPKEIAIARRQLKEIRSAVDNWAKEVKVAILGGIRHTVDGPRIVVNGSSFMLSPDPNFPGDPKMPLPPNFRRKFEASLEKPASFADFCSTWDTLQGRLRLITPDPTRLADTVVIVRKDGSRIASKYVLGVNQTAETIPVTIMSEEDRSIVSSINPSGTDLNKLPYAYSWYMGEDRIILPVAGSERRIDGQLVIAHARPELKPGSCKESFGTLVKQAEDSPDQSFAAIASLLEEAAAKEKSDSYTVFGMEFPVESASRWGILLILGILIYLWISLNEVSERLKPDDPGWDVAWIGVYRSMPARILFGALTIVLPVATIIVLGRSLIIQDILLGATYTGATAIGSVILSVFIVKWAPRHRKSDSESSIQPEDGADLLVP